MTESTTTYALAHGLRGFRSTTLRVRVTRRETGLVWVTTADLTDVGTKLVLDANKITEEALAVGGLRHRDGLVVVG